MPKNTNRNKIITLCVIILIIVLLFLLFITAKGKKQPAVKQQETTRDTSLHQALATPAKPDTLKTVSDTIVYKKIVRKTIRSHDSVAVNKGDICTMTVVQDTLMDSLFFADMGIPKSDTIKSPCATDTVAPWVYPDPSGGLHRKEVAIVLVATKPCIVEWKPDSTGVWKVYKGETIAIKKTTNIYMRAHDTCGNRMDERDEYYEIKPTETTQFCQADMEHIKVGAMDFCIDRYEWPNKKGVVPMAYISLYQAMDSCMAAGKYLCSSDEWTLACTGPYGWKYPYGSSYEQHACNTHDTTVRKSGYMVECRGYFDVYDMAGNLAEWTNTKSPKNLQFYNVKGGFWDSGIKSTCYDARYSYYPQNRHNPVGFRCCKAAKAR